MDKRLIRLSIRKRRLQLRGWNLLSYWANVALLSHFITLPIWAIAKKNLLDNHLFFFYLAMAVGIAAFIRYNLRRLRIQSYAMRITQKQFNDAFEAAGLYRNWDSVRINQEFAIAHQNVGWQWGGLHVLAVRRANEVFIHADISPDIGANPFSFGRNRNNRQVLLREIQKVLSGAEVLEEAKHFAQAREEKKNNTSEFGLKAMIKRIFRYLLVVLMSGVVIFVTYYNPQPQMLFIAIPIFALIYFIVKSDIALIRQQRENKRL